MFLYFWHICKYKSLINFDLYERVAISMKYLSYAYWFVNNYSIFYVLVLILYKLCVKHNLNPHLFDSPYDSFHLQWDIWEALFCQPTQWLVRSRSQYWWSKGTNNLRRKQKGIFYLRHLHIAEVDLLDDVIRLKDTSKVKVGPMVMVLKIVKKYFKLVNNIFNLWY